MTTRHDTADPTAGDRRHASRRPVALVTAVVVLAVTTVSWIGTSVLLADEPSPAVVIEAPEDGFLASVVGKDEIGAYAVIRLEARLDGDSTSWRWTSSAQPGALLNERKGTTRLYGAPCSVTEHRLTATALRRDGSWTSVDTVVLVESAY